MSRLFSFFLSAAIIVLCLWLNVSSYPNVLRQENVNASDEATAESTATTEDSNNSQPLNEQKDEKTQKESSKEKASTDEASEIKSSEKDDDLNSVPDVGGAPEKEGKSEKEPISAGVENNLLNVSVASDRQFSSSPGLDKSLKSVDKSLDSVVSETTSNAQTNADKPQGGKYVSIPSVEVDAFRSRFGSDSGRVVGVARASVVAD